MLPSGMTDCFQPPLICMPGPVSPPHHHHTHTHTHANKHTVTLNPGQDDGSGAHSVQTGQEMELLRVENSISKLLFACWRAGRDDPERQTRVGEDNEGETPAEESMISVKPF